jgi:hypothetical protein
VIQRETYRERETDILRESDRHTERETDIQRERRDTERQRKRE